MSFLPHREEFSRKAVALWKLVFVLALCLLPALLGGCGSGKGERRPPVTPEATINWAARSRFDGPSAALYARITLFDIDARGRTETFFAERPAGAAAVTQTYRAGRTIPAGTYPFRIDFFADRNVNSPIVSYATGSAKITVRNISLFTITNDVNNVASVEVEAGQQLLIGETRMVAFRVFDAVGQQIAVTPGSALFSFSDPAQNIVALNGDMLTGVTGGTTSIVATVNGVASPAVPVAVIANPTGETGGRIVGRVVDENSNPLSSVSVRTSDGTNVVSTTTGADGSFILENVPNGQRVVTFALNGRVTVAEVAVALGSEVTLTPTLNLYTGSPITALPIIDVDNISVNSENGTAVVEGRVTNTDNRLGVLIFNGGQTILLLDSSGRFRQVVVLRNGENTIQVEATNALGTTQSEVQTTVYNATFFFRTTLTWDGSGDVDLYTFAPDNTFSYFGDRTIPSGELDVDNTQESGPENFTARTLVPGRYRIAVNAYTRSINRRATVQVTYTQNGQSVTRTFGPYRFTQDSRGDGLPITTNTESWWRAVDIIVDESGNVRVEDPDTTPVGSSRAVPRKPLSK